MALWLVRAGRRGEREDYALERSVAVIGWDDLPDLTGVKTREDLAALMRETYPGEGENKLRNWTGQVWAFRDSIKGGDLAVLPLKRRAAIAIGRVTGEYVYTAGEVSNHVRPVDWLRKDIPRSAFDQDLLFSFGAFMTVCQISRNDAEARVRTFLEGGKLPVPTASTETVAPEDTTINIEQFARDQITKHIGQRFTGHKLARLVTAILNAQGYKTETSPPGADGGVDILAGRGPMGFDAPRLCVQVKSSDQPVAVGVLRELQGVMRSFGAEQGLLVVWGGFKQSVVAESRRLFFAIRLWDSGDLIANLLENYERLPEDVQAELPLKRIWTLVQEE